MLEEDRRIKLAMEAEKKQKLEAQNKQRIEAMERSDQASVLEKQRKDEELEQQARLERLRLETLKKLNEEHGRKLRQFVAESRSLPRRDNSKIEEVSSEARRQSMAVNEAEENIKTEQKKGLTGTFTKISNLESSIANLDWELERFEIEKMKAKTEKVMKQMSLSEAGRNGLNGEQQYV